MYDVVIVGAGIIGAMTARKLTEYKLKVCMVEKENDVAAGATKANSAIVHAGFDAKPGSLKAKLNVLGSEKMEQTASELGVKYRRNGSLVIGFTEEDEKTIQKLYDRGISNGVSGLEILSAEKLFEKEPNISKKAVCALYAPTGAIVCPYELCIAAAGNAMDNGADLKLNFKVTDLKREDGVWRIISENEEIRAKYVINAAGLYSDNIARLAGDTSFSVHPRSGDYILLDKECGTLTNCTIFRTPSAKGKGILLSPTVDGNYLTGPTAVDTEDKNDKSTSEECLAKIMNEARENIENIPFNKTITSFCGLRAVGSTGDFIIRVAADGFVNAAGIESPGLSASPAVAEYIVDLLKECGLKLEKNERFNPIRKPAHAFREASIEEKNKIIKENPSYGKIICRCEGVTEGEIIEAIRTNPGARDTDGIKRRTRSGMGRCQGGFCLPYVAELLAKELNIPFESVTKCGGNSEITIGRTKEEAYND